MTAVSEDNARPRKQKLTTTELEALPHLDAREVGQLLRITHDTVYRAIKTGHLPAENYGSGLRPIYRISREALAQWRASRAVTPPEQAGE